MHFWPKSLRCRPSLVHELRIGHAVVVPGAHDLEAAEQAGAPFLGDASAMTLRIVLLVGQRPRRRARTAGSSSRSWRPATGRSSMPGAQLAANLSSGIAADRRVGADLPDHDMGALGLHVGASCARSSPRASWPPMPLLKTWIVDAGHRRLEPDLELGGIGEVRIGTRRSPGSRTSPWRRCAAALARRSAVRAISQRLAEFEQLAAGAASAFRHADAARPARRRRRQMPARRLAASRDGHRVVAAGSRP